MTSGMTLTDKIVLSSLDICTIIEACAEYQVTKLKFGDLYLELGRHTPRATVPTQSFSPGTAIPEINHDQINQDSIETDEVRLREAEIAELMLTDPRKAEEMIENGELEDDTDESGEDE